MATVKHGRKKRREPSRETMLTNTDQPALPFTSHAPLSNPLTAKDEGTCAGIRIANFVMAIPQREVYLAGSHIHLLLHETLYNVFFDDSQFGRKDVAVPVFHASISRITAGFDGRFFVGSILTPAKGGPPTIGNGDGGILSVPSTPQGGLKSPNEPSIEPARTSHRGDAAVVTPDVASGASRTPEPFTHSEDYRSVTIHGRTYSLHHDRLKWSKSYTRHTRKRPLTWATISS